jgi:opacity protein-like surface antigen
LEFKSSETKTKGEEIMKRIIVLSASLLLLSSSFAFGANGLYVSGNLGVGFASDSDITESGFPPVEVSFDTGFAVAGAIGTAIDAFRVEGAVAYQQNDFDKAMGIVDLEGDISALSFLVNGYYDFDTKSAWTPYLTAGLGFSMIDVNDLGIAGEGDRMSDDDTVFAYQLGAGIGYAVNDAVTLDASYRYFATSDPDFSGTEAEVASHNIFFGVRYSFK